MPRARGRNRKMSLAFPEPETQENEKSTFVICLSEQDPLNVTHATISHPIDVFSFFPSYPTNSAIFGSCVNRLFGDSNRDWRPMGVAVGKS